MSETQYAKEGDRYARQRKAEALAELSEAEKLQAGTHRLKYSIERGYQLETVAESTLVPGVVQSEIDIRDKVDTSGAPEPRTQRYLPAMTYYSVPPIELPDFDPTPAEALGRAEWAARCAAAVEAMKTVLSICDLDPCLEYGRLQLADQWCHAIEWVLTGKEAYGKKLKAELDLAERSYDGSEIREQEIRRLRDRKRMAAMNWRLCNHLFDAMFNLRNELISRSGIDFDSYRSNEDMQAAKARKRQDTALVARALRMTPEQWAREKERILDVKLTLNGIEDAEKATGTTFEQVAIHRERQQQAAVQAKLEARNERIRHKKR